MNHKPSFGWVVVAGFLVQAVLALPSYAAGSEYLVRLREPQNTKAQTITTLHTLSSLKDNALPAVQIVNGEEGVVKLSFKSATEAKEMLSELAGSSQILNIAPNLRYHLALSTRFKTSEPSDADQSFHAPLLPLATLFAAATGLPDVLPPPSSVTPGADPLAAQDWAVQSIRLPEVAETTAFTSSSKIVTAVIDTGIDYNHEDLRGALWRKPGDPSVIGYDFAHNSPKPYDVVHFDVQGCINDYTCASGMDQSGYLVNPGHGTHCAGHVAAVANNSLGIRGVGAGTKVMGLKFFKDFGEQGAGGGDDAAAIQSIDFAIKNGVKVISASWGGRSSKADADSSELKQALLRAQQAGVIVVVAAGNDGINQDTDAQPDFPAAYHLDNMIVVAATDKNDNVADFSNYGAQSVDIGAPGVKILSTTVGNHYDDVVAKYTGPDGQAGEMDWDGTSMATPIVAGAVALVWSKYPNLDYHQIRDKIIKSVRHSAGLEGKVATAGVLDVAAALKQ